MNISHLAEQFWIASSLLRGVDFSKAEMQDGRKATRDDATEVLSRLSMSDYLPIRKRAGDALVKRYQ